jgi:nitrogen fixation/metabolism regulation signal transduction histidine kinase
MQRPNRLGWFPTNLLLLAAVVFIGVLVFYLYEVSAEEAKSTSTIVMDAIGLTLFFGTLVYVQAVIGGICYLLLLQRIAQRVSGVRLRALALLLSPIVALPLILLLEAWYPIVLALPYGAVVRLPKQDQPPLANA